MSKFKYDLAVIGLGYVGLPLAIEAANNTLKVAGYDINEIIVDNLNNSMSHVEDISDQALNDALTKELFFTSDSKVLGESEYIVISVPTPLTNRNIFNMGHRIIEIIYDYLVYIITSNFKATISCFNR